ncbi:SAM-dependent methyltransferase [Actinomadura rudentiformis]|uniref:SAM-dependent methyltransferase n=1 Tax=Actinomadura rudentiformis TaxID=359158 RepID=UPI00178C50C6|nr:SAM-dependent methyltransferase [Actinomadura rudentiformis]
MTGPANDQSTAGAQEQAPLDFDTSKPNIARVYDFLLGGKDNFAADRVVGDQIKLVLPQVHLGVQAQRAVLRRAIRYLVIEAGIRQLIDIGSGLPTAGNVHEVAHAIDPQVRVVYTDNDPVVLAHARALLANNPTTTVADGDLLQPEQLLKQPVLRHLIDLDRPVGLLLCGIMHYLNDQEDPGGIIARLMALLPSGSHVFLHHLVKAGTPGEEAAEAALRKGIGRGTFRTPDQVAAFLTGLDLVPPGVVRVPDWRPDPDDHPSDDPVLNLAVAALARKP